MNKIRKRQKCYIFCTIFGLIIAVFGLFIFPIILKPFIESNIVMTNDTYTLWGENPGKTETITSRDFTFYNFTNPRQFLYLNHTPKFTQLSGYIYQQMSNFTNYKYIKDDTQISFDYWLHFQELSETKNYSDYVSILNPVTLGFWSQLQTLNLSTFALQGFGGLFLQLNQTIKLQAIGQGIAALFINQESLKLMCLTLGIESKHCKLIWNDPINGLSTGDNYLPWVKLAYEHNIAAKQYIKDYFSFSTFQINAIEDQFFEWCQTINSVLNNWYCNGNQCSGYELSILQLSSGGVTKRPPVGQPVDSICQSGNITCIGGSPEISTYLAKQFRQKYPDPQYQILKFSVETFRQLFSPNNGTLLNIGNLSELFSFGSMYDFAVAMKWQNTTLYLQLMQNMTHSDSKNHTFVIWQWVKYITTSFILKFDKKGSGKIVGMAGLFAQSIYQSISNFGGWILQDYLFLLSSETIGSCSQFVSKITSNPHKIQLVCKNVQEQSYKSYKKLLQPCIEIKLFKQLKQKYNLNISEMNLYCDKINEVISKAHSDIYQHYSCIMSQAIKRCTAYQLGLIQWFTSNITLHPLKKKNNRKSTLTASDWNSQIAAFEYKFFLNITRQTYTQNEHYNISQLIDLISFNKFFSVPMMTDMFLQENRSQFQKTYYWQNMDLLKKYAKFIVIEVGFGGLTMKRKVKDIIFGYTDQFLQQLRITNPMQGGDPSINSLVAFNEPNSTLDQAKLYPQVVYSGSNDTKKTRQYVSIYDKNYITFNKTWFDGYNINSEFISPYSKQINIVGTDAFQNPPYLEKQQDIQVYITTLFRVAKLKYEKDVSKYGYDLRKYKIKDQFLQSQQQNPQNAVFYQHFNGFLNLSFQGLPLYISRNHFYKAPKNWSQLIQIYSSDHQHKMTANQWDDTYLFAEPYSGASFTAVVFLQTNYYFTNDILFNNTPRMLPIFSVYRSGNISEATALDLFSDLKFALNARWKIFAIGLIFLLFFIIVFIASRMKTNTIQNLKISSLAYSHDIQQ